MKPILVGCLYFSSFLACLATASGCAPDADFYDNANGELGEVQQSLLTSTVAQYTNAGTNTTLAYLNGKKTVATASGLHAVWALNGSIYYATSSTGTSWGPSITVDSGAAVRPSITATEDGTIGIVYVRNVTDSFGTGDIYYRTMSVNGTWGPAFKVTSDFKSSLGRDPSIAAHNNDMHLTWSRGAQVQYASFPVSQTSSLATASDVNLYTICSNYSITYPTIAVSDGATPTASIVRIAWYAYVTPLSGCGSNNSFGWSVAEKPSNPNPISWPTIYSRINSGVSNSGSVSLSLAANRSTGDFYLATSDIVNGSEQTSVWYENAKDTTDTWRSFTLLPRRAIVDVSAATINGESRFRVAYSDFTLGSNGYGPTHSRTGTWATPTSTTPTWIDSSVLSTNGRIGSSLLWDRYNITFFALLEVFRGGTEYALVTVFDRIGETNLGSAMGGSVAWGNTCTGSNNYSPPCAYSNAIDQSFYWTTPSDQNSAYLITTFGSSYDTILSVTDAITGENLGCNDDAGGTVQSMVKTPFLTTGRKLRITVDGFSSSCGDFYLNIYRLTADLGSSLGSPIMWSNTCFGINDWYPSCRPSSTAPNTNALWIAPQTRTYTFTSMGSDYDTVLEVFNLANTTSLGCNDDAGGTLQSSLTLNLQQGQAVLVRMDGYSNYCGGYYLNIQ